MRMAFGTVWSSELPLFSTNISSTILKLFLNSNEGNCDTILKNKVKNLTLTISCWTPLFGTSKRYANYLIAKNVSQIYSLFFKWFLELKRCKTFIGHVWHWCWSYAKPWQILSHFWMKDIYQWLTQHEVKGMSVGRKGCTMGRAWNALRGINPGYVSEIRTLIEAQMSLI